MDREKTRRFVETEWDRSVMPALMDFVRIPALSPGFDDDWAKNGHLDRAVALAEAWTHETGIPGLSAEIVRIEGRSPLLFFEIPGSADGTVLMYGHLDKQPPAKGWDDGLGPWDPVIRDGKLYGRGAADDGYALFASLTALRAVIDQGLPHARCVGLIECCEESGSFDLPPYIEKLRERIGAVDLVLCLDSGCGDYERMWITNSLRGMIGGTLSVDILEEGVHSGDASGIVPSTFRVARQLLDRLEDAATGRVLPAELSVEIPAERAEQVRRAAAVLGAGMASKFPFVPGARAAGDDPVELLLARTWRPQLEITGAAGFPRIEDAGNVLRPHTALKLSMRLPPTCEPESAAEAMKRLLESDPPYGARVSFEFGQTGAGWNAPATPSWFDDSASASSRAYFGEDVCYFGEGGSIPLMALLESMFPGASFLITGVLGPKSNAHGPNEFLELATVKRLTCCVAEMIADHAAAS